VNKLTSLPQELELLKNRPDELYFLGNLALLNKRKISIVGSRKGSSYSKEVTYTLAKKLSNAGFAVVSGGALGIDTKAHEGSFPNTIAVFANSLDLFYPSTNRKLISDIYQNGLALSEKTSKYLPQKYDFVLRNRITVALGEVLVISEADESSGSLRSAEYALELGREIYVFPHRMDESKGTNRLLKDGIAKAIFDIDEFVVSLGGVEQNEVFRDELLDFCEKAPFFEEAIAEFGERVYEYEILGKIAVKNGRIYNV